MSKTKGRDKFTTEGKKKPCPSVTYNTNSRGSM